MGRVVGIDLGTTSAVVAALDCSDPRYPKPFVLPNAEGSRSTPSVVAFTNHGGTLIGDAAKRQTVANVRGTVSSAKQYMGTDQTFACGGRTYGAIRISALILGKLKRDAEAHLGEEVTGAVVTVPAHFSHAARLATREAGELAGLPVLRLLNEPTAAALVDGIDRDDETVLVVHCGGGSFGISLVEVGDGVIEVKASRGDARLGGDDWDRETARHLAARFQSLHGVDPSADPTSLRRLCEAAENAKVELSSATEAMIEVPCVAMSGAGPLHLHDRLTRKEFLHVTQPLLVRCAAALHQVFVGAGVSVPEVSRVVMTGGATRMPALISLVRDHFGDHAPTMVTQPSESVAYGAALQAGVLTGVVRDALVLEATPHSLGIATRGGVMSRLIERDNTLPTMRSEIFTPVRDVDAADGAIVQIPVYEGESENAADNALIGILNLTDLTMPAQGRAADIKVTLDVDHQALVRLSATDHATGTSWSRAPDGDCTVKRTEVRREPRSRPPTAPMPSDFRQQPPSESRSSDDLSSLALGLLGALIALAIVGGVLWAFW
ncbi:Hsp70 family protein [Streptomyces europaeiscabiei]|uniref:Hsp70 family protein n=1 Tax=Streptomyces europaeiscabiei TaxID=146819 RepID=UPI0029A9CB80|nr:Hsp70 family protein [Streptomyces europaeiscabiei]MDX3689402.1 Hsp70 family protein [Streptomyces europaeiscabiei]